MRRSFAVSWGDTIVVPFSLRLRLRSLLVRMCALNAFPRLNLPDAVFLKRLAAPRWLFNFGMMFLLSFGHFGFRLRGRLLAADLLRQDRVHLVAFLARRGLGDREVGELADQPLQDAAADLGVRHLAPAEEDRRLHLVAVLEEALDVLLLELVVVLVHLRPELDFLDLDDLLMLLRRPRALLLLVLIAPEVHDAADRRHRRRGDLHEVEPLLPRDGQRLRRRHDPELRAVLVDDADFTDPDAFVDPRAIVAPRTAIKCDNSLLRNQLAAARPASGSPFAATSACARRMNSSTGRAPRSPPLRLRTETV